MAAAFYFDIFSPDAIEKRVLILGAIGMTSGILFACIETYRQIKKRAFIDVKTELIETTMVTGCCGCFGAFTGLLIGMSYPLPFIFAIPSAITVLLGHI